MIDFYKVTKQGKNRKVVGEKFYLGKYGALQMKLRV